jgi:signal transduction histidine kinase/DNA-binding response OmpR family regulator
VKRPSDSKSLEASGGAGDPDLTAVKSMLQALIDAVDGPAFVKDAEGRYFMANAALAGVFDLAGAGALIGRRDEDLLSRPQAAEIGASDQRVLDAGTTVEIEQEIAGRGFLWRKGPWRDSKSRVVGVVGVARDLTGPRRQAVLLEESEELLGLAQAAGRVGIFEWQVPAGTVRLSPQFLSLYGLADFDGRYETWRACIFREDQIRVAGLIEDAFAAVARELRAEFRITNANNGALQWIEARNIIFYDLERRPVRVVGVNVDITEQKRAMVQLRAFTETLEEQVKERTRELETEYAARHKAEESLRQAHKMEAVGQLTGGIAHDLNNMLTVVLGGLEAIGRQMPKLPLSPATARIVRAKDMAIQGAQRTVTLTSRLLAFSRQQPLSPKALDANKLVAGICELMRRTLGESVVLESVLAGGLWHTFADANQLENTLLNLALNARDAMPSGGKVTIETANCDLDEAYVRAVAEPVKSGQYVLIAVADTGIGMDQLTLEKAFEPFFTTKDVGKGTGLGLSQVYGFVRQSAGHVKIYSELGAGTTVKIYLPRHLGEMDGAKADGLPQAARAIGTESILVVEDDEALRKYATEILRELGYRVVEAESGAAALEILGRDSEIDLLFSDVVMPGGMNGRQLADEAIRRRPGLKVLFTTGYTRNAIVHHGRLDPGIHLITKPFTYATLAGKVRELLDSPAQPRCILVVENDLLVRRVAVDALQALGFRVQETGSTAEALDKIRAQGGGIDAAIVDVGLPDGRGDELVLELRKMWKDLPIVIATGYAENAIRTLFEADKLVGFLQKPFSPVDLAKALNAISVLPKRG